MLRFIRLSNLRLAQGNFGPVSYPRKELTTLEASTVLPRFMQSPVCFQFTEEHVDVGKPVIRNHNMWELDFHQGLVAAASANMLSTRSYMNTIIQVSTFPCQFASRRVRGCDCELAPLHTLLVQARGILEAERPERHTSVPKLRHVYWDEHRRRVSRLSGTGNSLCRRCGLGTILRLVLPSIPQECV
jgi:hypothetical protein